MYKEVRCGREVAGIDSETAMCIWEVLDCEYKWAKKSTLFLGKVGNSGKSAGVRKVDPISPRKAAGESDDISKSAQSQSHSRTSRRRMMCGDSFGLSTG